MFYINYQGGNMVGVVDTSDFVEEFYPNAEVEKLMQKGIIISPADVQSYLLSFILDYINLTEFLKAEGIKDIPYVLKYAEEFNPKKYKEDDKVPYSIVRTRYFGDYSGVVAKIRKDYKQKKFGYRSVDSSVYAKFDKMLTSAYNGETSKLTRLENTFCKRYCFDRDLVHRGFQLIRLGL